MKTKPMPYLDETMKQIDERLKFQPEHIKTCTRLFVSLMAKMKKAGASEEVIAQSLIDVLYQELEPNIIEPMLEDVRRERNEAFGGTWEEVTRWNEEGYPLIG